MDVDAVVARVLVELVAMGDPARADHDKSYQKSDLTFVGCGAPAIRATAKTFKKENKNLDRESLWRVFEALWKEPVWEARAVGVGLLELYPQLLTPRDLARFKELVVEASGWAFNDWLGCHVIGGIVRRNSESLATIDVWSKDDDLWVRRVAMQTLLLPMRAGDLTEWPRFVRYAEPRLEDKDFWTRKVVGWICREVSKKNPQPVVEFLQRNRARLSGLTLREGAKYLPAKDRKNLGLDQKG